MSDLYGEGFDRFGDPIEPESAFESEPSLTGGTLGGSRRGAARTGGTTVRAAGMVGKALLGLVKQIVTARNALKSGTSPSGGSNTNPSVAGHVQSAQQLTNSTPSANANTGTVGKFNNFMGGFTGSPVLNSSGGWQNASGGGAAFGTAVKGLSQMGSAIVGQIDNRTNQMYGKSLSYDKLSVLYQQTQNISQQQFVNRFAQPLMQQRLGMGGAATLLGLQAQTGLNANLNASSVAAMQAATGYMYNTQDMAQAMATLASPQVNNRMTMTLGTGMYGPGGKQRNMMQVMQSVVRGAGLTNQNIVQSGMQMGSITRAKLSALGLPEDMQNMVLQYAQENINFQKKGGKGMYDPSRASDRKLMGIENNFSTQEQETQRTREARDLSFYKKQNDNYAALEKQTQSLTRAMQGLEESMSGLIGARMKMRNNKGMALGKTILGGALVATGAIMSATGVGSAAGVPIAMMGAGLFSSGVSGFSGGGIQSDPMPGTPPSSTGGQRRVNTQMDATRSVSKLNPQFRSRIEQMLNDNPNVGIGDGHRDSSKQRTLFLSRYSKTKEKTGIFWEGSYWKKNPGVPDATPPGMSMHEVGLAVDLTGDLKWVQEHASKYGLKTFANSGEPWHVQPAELPNDRVAYEKAGAGWGLNGAQPLDKRSFVAGMGGAQKTSSANATRMGTPTSTSSKIGGATTPYPSNKKLTIDQITKLLYDTGFRGKDLVKAVAIAGRESIGFNPRAFNGNQKTGDLSYGLFQINMTGALGPSRRKSQKLSSNDDLFDPAVNARVAYQMYLDNKYNQHRDPFYDWGPYKGKSATYGAAESYLPKATEAVRRLTSQSAAPAKRGAAKTGDPMPVQRMSVGESSGNTFVGGSTITISPVIQVGSGSAPVDTHKVAQEAARIIERDLKVALLRKN